MYRMKADHQNCAELHPHTSRGYHSPSIHVTGSMLKTNSADGRSLAICLRIIYPTVRITVMALDIDLSWNINVDDMISFPFRSNTRKFVFCSKSHLYRVRITSDLGLANQAVIELCQRQCRDGEMNNGQKD